eukprot:TRINITY_DN12782_c0_g1_i1.p1 TRINITY_DN12782_c0_g1~~TRINITY_DN12782_c0_g1_i1.p1  ORF type:complete len:283 (-),score=44.05 TRINITY_DN12782_c0_g1_i1:13-840(-)
MDKLLFSLSFMLIISLINCGEAEDSSGQNYKWTCDCGIISTSEKYCAQWTCEIERISAKCFPGTSQVLLPNFQTKSLADLQIGDKVLTFDKTTFQFIEDEVVEFLHYVPPKNNSEKSNSYLKIITDSGNILKVSKDHLLFIEDKNSSILTTILAKNLQISDILYGIGLENQIFGYQQSISAIEELNENIQELGEYAPLTSTGSLIVDGIFASSYANLNNQKVADLVFSPYIFFQQWMPIAWRNYFKCYTEEGINCYANFFMKISEKLPFFNYQQE